MEIKIDTLKIRKWIHSNVLWAATIALGFASWQITSLLWNMTSDQWKCGDSPKAIIGILGFLVLVGSFIIVGANALMDSHEKSKRDR